MYAIKAYYTSMHFYSYILFILLYTFVVFSISSYNYRSIASFSYSKDILDIYSLGSRTITFCSKLLYSMF